MSVGVQTEFLAFCEVWKDSDWCFNHLFSVLKPLVRGLAEPAPAGSGELLAHAPCFCWAVSFPWPSPTPWSSLQATCRVQAKPVRPTGGWGQALWLASHQIWSQERFLKKSQGVKRSRVVSGNQSASNTFVAWGSGLPLKRITIWTSQSPWVLIMKEVLTREKGHWPSSGWACSKNRNSWACKKPGIEVQGNGK